MEGLAVRNAFAKAYEGRRVLVTGHTGFKGSWLCLWLTALGARVTGFALAPDTEPSHWALLNLDGVRDIRGDLRNAQDIEQAIALIQPEVIFHLAAQPLVRRSYREPVETFNTNILGLVHLLEAIRKTDSVRAFVNATTDKVYLEQPTNTGYREDHALGGHDPYSTSKACAELVTECYRKSFFQTSHTRIATARAGNVIGGGDWAEDRLVPDLVRAAKCQSPLQVRNPNAVRPWQHVLEPLSGYLLLGQHLLAHGRVEGPWNFGPSAGATLPVSVLISQLGHYWPELRSEHHAGPHPHEAMTLQLDCSKAERLLDWRPVWDAETTFRHTSQWYRTFYDEGALRSRQDLRDYVAAAHSRGLAWAA